MAKPPSRPSGPSPAAAKWAAKRSVFVPGSTITDAVPAVRKPHSSGLSSLAHAATHPAAQALLDVLGSIQAGGAGPGKTAPLPAPVRRAGNVLAPVTNPVAAASEKSVLAGNRAAPLLVGLPSDYTVSNITQHPLRTYQRQAAKVRDLQAQMAAAYRAGDQKRLDALTREATQYDVVFGPLGGKGAKAAGEAAVTAGKAIRAGGKTLVFTDAMESRLTNLEASVKRNPIDAADLAAMQREEKTIATLKALKAESQRTPERTAAPRSPTGNGQPPRPPDVPPVAAAGGEPPIGANPVEQIRGGIRGARRARKEQNLGYSVERSKRFAAFEAAARANPTYEGVQAAKVHLRGELPKLDYEGFGELDQEAMDALVKKIWDHPRLLTGQRISLVDALDTVAQGRVPQPRQLDLMEHVFGKNVRDNLSNLGNLGIFGHAKDLGYEIVNVPRAIMASLDFSAVLRQGFVMGTRHPVLAARNIGPMFKMFGSAKVYEAALQAVKDSPNFPLYHEMGLAITDLGKLSNREEAFYSGIAEKFVPGVRQSSRAYSGFLVKLRADVADHLLERFHEEGVNILDEHFLDSLGRYINSATGRGTLTTFKHAAKALNTFFFAPRLMKSRFEFFSPRYYASLHPAVRKQALRAAIHTVGTLSFMLGLAALAGAKVVHDPRNADFAKIRLGNTRFDIAAGHQQWVRLMSQLATSTVISSTTGKKLNLRESGYGKTSSRDIFQRFFEGKLSPPFAIVNDWAKGADFQGQPFSVKQEAVTHMIPLLAQDSKDLYNDRQGGVDGITAAFLGYGIGAFGVGTQTYGARPAATNLSTVSTRGGKPRLSRPASGGVSYKPSGRATNKP